MLRTTRMEILVRILISVNRNNTIDEVNRANIKVDKAKSVARKNEKIG